MASPFFFIIDIIHGLGSFQVQVYDEEFIVQRSSDDYGYWQSWDFVERLVFDAS